MSGRGAAHVCAGPSAVTPYLEQGLSKTAIARTLHVSRRTVYHWSATGQLDRELDDGPVQYTPQRPVVRKIDSYRKLHAARERAAKQV